MTREQIKQQHSMLCIVQGYGLKVNRAGFSACPFHNDKSPSMKVYQDSYHCFSCGANGDIFSLTMHMNSCDFKTAFMMLGGTYEKPTFESKLAIYKMQKAKEKRALEERVLREKKNKCNRLIDKYRDGLEVLEPLSDKWCEYMNKLQFQLHLHEYLNT